MGLFRFRNKNHFPCHQAGRSTRHSLSGPEYGKGTTQFPLNHTPDNKIRIC